MRPFVTETLNESVDVLGRPVACVPYQDDVLHSDALAGTGMGPHMLQLCVSLKGTEHQSHSLLITCETPG